MRKVLEEIDSVNRETIVRTMDLSDNDLVFLDADNFIYVSRGGHVYIIKDDLSEVDPENPLIELDYTGEMHPSIRGKFRTYREFRKFLS